jgi:hypothetical protein
MHPLTRSDLLRLCTGLPLAGLLLRP